MYKFRIESKTIPVKINNNLKLYEACKKTIGVNGGLVIEGDRLVAFYCSYTGLVKAGFGAYPYEKEQINNFGLGK